MLAYQVSRAGSKFARDVSCSVVSAISEASAETPYVSYKFYSNQIRKSGLASTVNCIYEIAIRDFWHKGSRSFRVDYK
jgi:hypothetical protein